MVRCILHSVVHNPFYTGSDNFSAILIWEYRQFSDKISSELRTFRALGLEGLSMMIKQLKPEIEQYHTRYYFEVIPVLFSFTSNICGTEWRYVPGYSYVYRGLTRTISIPYGTHRQRCPGKVDHVSDPRGWGRNKPVGRDYRMAFHYSEIIWNMI